MLEDSVQTAPSTAPRVSRQESLYPPLQDENHGNSARPTVQHAQSGYTNRPESQKPASSAAQASRHERRKPLADITGSANNDASQPALPRSNTPTASAYSNTHSSITQGSRTRAGDTATTAQLLTRSSQDSQVAAEATGLPTEEVPQDIPSRGIGDKLVGLTTAYVNARRKILGEPRYAGNGQIADYSCLLITHPEAVQEWMDDPAYSKDRITSLLQWYIQISQVYGPATVCKIMDRRHDNSPHELDHRVILHSIGGTPLNGSIINAGPIMESTDGTLAQSDFIRGDPVFELVHYRRSWEQLPIGTSVTDIIHHYPNHMKDEHIDAFEQQGISGKTMSMGQPKALRDELVSVGVSDPVKPENAMNKRLQYRKNDIVTRYGAAGWNNFINSSIKLRALGPAVSSGQPKTVSHGFIPNPEDQIDYRKKTFSDPPTRRAEAVVEGYKRDKTVDAQKKTARAFKNSILKSKKLLADFFDKWTNDDPDVHRPAGSSRRQIRKKRRHDEDDTADESAIHNNIFGPPPKRQRAAHSTFYPVGQSTPQQQHGGRHQSGYMPAQPRHNVATNHGYQRSSGLSSQSHTKLVIDSDGKARLQRTSSDSNLPFQAQPTESPHTSLHGHKRGRDEDEEDSGEGIGEPLGRALKRLKQSIAVSGPEANGTVSQTSLDMTENQSQPSGGPSKGRGCDVLSNFDLDSPVADDSQPGTFTSMLQGVTSVTDWLATSEDTNAVTETGPLDLSSCDQHLTDDIGHQESIPMSGEVGDVLDFMRGPGQYPQADVATPLDDSPRSSAQSHATSTFQPSSAGSPPHPSKNTKRGHEEFDKDDQTPQETWVDRPRKKLKETAASTRNEVTADLWGSELLSIFSADGMGIGRGSMPLDVPQLEVSTASAQDSELSHANQPIDLGLGTTGIEYPLASANSQYISNLTGGTEAPYTFEESQNSAPVAAKADPARFFNFDNGFGTGDTEDSFPVEESDDFAPVAPEATAAGGFNIDDDFDDLFGPELMAAYDWSL